MCWLANDKGLGVGLPGRVVQPIWMSMLANVTVTRRAKPALVIIEENEENDEDFERLSEELDVERE